MRHFFATLLLCLLPQACGFTVSALAQHNHTQHHASYQSWVNKDGKGCCNDRDCGELADQDERNTATGTEVRIEGQWCPVLTYHYLKSGNAPNWQTSHVCVSLTLADDDRGPCQRLLCYQPKPGF